jgi:aminoglycoside phosphotransferase (APT) family kinase protein
MALANRLEPVETARRLQAWLETRLSQADEIRVDGVTSMRSSGFSTEAVMFDAAWREDGQEREARLAARVGPIGDGLFPDYDLAQEYRVMEAVAVRTGVPVPRVLWHEPDPGVLGSAFLVMERAEGRTLGDDPPFTTEGWLVELSPDQQALLYDNMLRMIVDLHGVDPFELGLADAGPPDPGDTPLERQIAYMERYCAFAAGDGSPDPLITAGIEWLKHNQPSGPEPSALCWGDARFANVIVADDLSIAAAVDWEEATVANPELDLGYFLYALNVHTVGIGAPLPPGFPGRERTVARYEELSGREVVNVDYYETAAAVRGVLIMSRVAQIMIAAGFLPPDSDMLTNNPTTHLLAAMLGLPVPGAAASTWVGHRD